MATAEIVSIGSELLLGQIVDTNSAWIAERLTDSGSRLVPDGLLSMLDGISCGACGQGQAQTEERGD